MSARIRRRALVRGRVQGVWFRDSLRQHAQAEHVDGWARNRADGGVEAVLEGAADAVQRVLAFCRTGPRSAEVTDVIVSEEAPEGLSGFEVR